MSKYDTVAGVGVRQAIIGIADVNGRAKRQYAIVGYVCRSKALAVKGVCEWEVEWCCAVVTLRTGEQGRTGHGRA